MFFTISNEINDSNGYLLHNCKNTKKETEMLSLSHISYRHHNRIYRPFFTASLSRLDNTDNPNSEINSVSSASAESTTI